MTSYLCLHKIFHGYFTTMLIYFLISPLPRSSSGVLSCSPFPVGSQTLVREIYEPVCILHHEFPRKPYSKRTWTDRSSRAGTKTHMTTSRWVHFWTVFSPQSKCTLWGPKRKEKGGEGKDSMLSGRSHSALPMLRTAWPPCSLRGVICTGGQRNELQTQEGCLSWMALTVIQPQRVRMLHCFCKTGRNRSTKPLEP